VYRRRTKETTSLLE
jgi:Retrotransposon gag protein